MVLRPEALRRRFERLEEVLSTLERLEYDPADTRAAWAVERGLQLAAEIVFDIGNHVLSAGFGTAAEGYEQILEQLGAQGVIDAALRSELAGLGGFRNVLVHGYLDLDPQLVAEALRQTPRLFSAYRMQVEDWLTRTIG